MLIPSRATEAFSEKGKQIHMLDEKPDAAKDVRSPTQRKEDGGERATPEAAPPSSEVHAPQSKQNKSRQQDKHWLDYAVAAFALIAALGGVAAAVFTGIQAWVARDTEISQLRPWLIVKSGSNFRTDANGGFDIDVSMKNYGQTIANNVLMTGFMVPTYAGWLQKGLARRCKDVDNVRYNNGFQVAPADETWEMVNLYNQPVISLGDDNTVVDDDTLQRGQYFIFGCITYSDRFKIPYKTRFCFRPDGKAKSAARDDIIAVEIKRCGFFDDAE